MAAATIPAGFTAGATGAGWPRLRRAIEPAMLLETSRAPQPANSRPASAASSAGSSAWREPLRREAAVIRGVETAQPAPDGQQPDPQRAAAAAEQAALALLADRCLAGDAAAWESLVRSQNRRVYGLCFRFTGSQTEAEDLTQEVFLKMYRNLASFDASRGSFVTWLTTLTRNLLVDHYRRSRLDRMSESLDQPMDGEDDGPSRADRLADGRAGQEKHVAGVELRVKIQRALEQVSPELREAVILRDLEDMDYKDIAEVLGVPQGTVKSRISRGRAELARLLKGLEGQVM